MVFNAAFSNISVISWWSVLLVEETVKTHKSVILTFIEDSSAIIFPPIIPN